MRTHLLQLLCRLEQNAALHGIVLGRRVVDDNRGSHVALHQSGGEGRQKAR